MCYARCKKSEHFVFRTQFCQFLYLSDITQLKHAAFSVAIAQFLAGQLDQFEHIIFILQLYFDDERLVLKTPNSSKQIAESNEVGAPRLLFKCQLGQTLRIV